MTPTYVQIYWTCNYHDVENGPLHICQGLGTFPGQIPLTYAEVIKVAADLERQGKVSVNVALQVVDI